MAETLYSARYKPIAGLNTALDPMALPDGAVSELENFRIGDQMLECRGGMTAVLSSISTTAEFRGCWGGYIWGGNYLVVAVYDTGVSKTRVYASSSPAGAWDELTASSGKYGDTRLTNNAPVRFAVVPSLFDDETATGGNALVYADGGALRVTTSPASTATAIVYEIEPQTGVQRTPVRVRVIEPDAGHIDLQPGGETFTGWVSASDSTPQTDFLLSGSGTDPNRQWLLTIGTGTDNAHVTTVNAGFDLSSFYDSPQDRLLLIGVDTSYGMLWDKVGLELRTATSGGTVKVIWDPTNPDDYAAPIPIAVDTSQRTLWAFKFTKETSGIDYNYTRFTWKCATAEAPGAAQLVYIWLYAITQGAAAYSDWSVAVSMYNSGSRAESPGVIYSEYVTDRVQDWGGPVLNGLKLPRDPILDCTFYAKIKVPTQAELNKGVDTANFFYKQPGESRYRFARAVPVGSYGGGAWSAFGGTAGVVSEYLAGPSYSYQAESSAVYLPDAFHIAAPNAAEVCWANDRLFVGQVANTKAALLISERGAPLRFRRFTEFNNGAPDPDGPVTLSLGSSNVKAIAPMASSLIGVDTVFVLTDQDALALSGSDSFSLSRVSRISRFGTVSPYSVVEMNSKVFYLDTEMQVRELGGGQVVPITRKWVDDQLQGIPAAYRKYVCAAAWDEKYYLSFTPSGATTNTKMLVWDDMARQWVNDAPPKAVQGILSWFDGTNQKKRLVAFGPNTSTATTLSAYEYDLATQSQDLGTTNITCSVTFAEMHAQDGKAIHINRVGITADDVASGTGTVTRTYKPGGSTGVASINLDGSVNQIVRYDGVQTVTGDGKGISAKVRVSLGLTAGKKVYKVVAEVEPRDHAYDRSS